MRFDETSYTECNKFGRRQGMRRQSSSFGDVGGLPGVEYFRFRRGYGVRLLVFFAGDKRHLFAGRVEPVVARYHAGRAQKNQAADVALLTAFQHSAHTYRLVFGRAR